MEKESEQEKNCHRRKCNGKGATEPRVTLWKLLDFIVWLDFCWELLDREQGYPQEGFTEEVRLNLILKEIMRFDFVDRGIML